MTSRDSSSAKVILGRTLNFLDDPADVGEAKSHRFEEQGAVVVGPDGRIVWAGDRADLPDDFARLPREDHGTAILLPGFIDAHVHFPQHRMLAAPGVDLLDWLKRFTFQEEARYADRTHADAAADVFLDTLIAHGSTSAAVFSSVHAEATDALFSAARDRGMALVAGKTMMDRNAPEEVRDEAEQSARDSEALIDRWHGTDRLRYAITPRFAFTSTEAQLAACGSLVAAHPDVMLQTHLAESSGEIEEVRRLYPWSKDYTEVYDRFGLLGSRSLFAHGIHLSERECARLHETGSVIVHCPTSNSFLGSGLFDIDHLGDRRRPVRLSVATDIGGGTSYSLLATLGEAYKVARLAGRRLDSLRAFYLATLGNARALGLDGEIGGLESGQFADLVVLDPCATPVLARRQELSESLADVLFSLMLLGDDRCVRATYVAGERLKGEAP
jgi:guanine deaminase